MLVFILPVIILALAALTAISAKSSESIINKQIAQHMSSELLAQMNGIGQYLEVVESTATNVSRVVGTTYKTTDLSTYEAMLKQIVMDNDLVLGSGIWFEPYAYDSKEEYVGPYIYKDGKDTVVTYDYSNAEYDYFSQDYYTMTKGATAAVITDPYYDETSGLIMSSCSMPIYDNNKTYLGCVTVDIELTAIQNLVNNIKVGENGTAMLISGSGTYLGCSDDKKVSEAMNMTEDSNSSLALAAASILNNDRGITSYEANHQTYNLYYDTLKNTGWKLIIEMPQAELHQPVRQLIDLLLPICLIAIILSVMIVLIQVRSISKNIKKVQTFAGALAEGDFSVEQLKVETRDELGNMGHSLNEMYGNNKQVIQNIITHAEEVNISSKNLNEAADNLLTQFEKIESYMTDVNEAMMSAGAATEEVNASTEEVKASVTVFTQETEMSMKMTEEIQNRAQKIGESSQQSFQHATQLSAEYSEKLQKSMEHAKVVDNIGTMAGVISEVAEQINLLSLNASIEAARAGEQGKGFAVVAMEIGKLAKETSNAVSQIQGTISDVEGAFKDMAEESHSLLGFVQQTVMPDYNSFIGVAEQYKSDAVSIENNAKRISEMALGIQQIMDEVSMAIQNITESTQSTADNSSKIMDSMNGVAEVVDHVSEMSNKQAVIATNLNDVVCSFKLD